MSDFKPGMKVICWPLGNTLQGPDHEWMISYLEGDKAHCVAFDGDRSYLTIVFDVSLLEEVKPPQLRKKPGT